jgi:glycosyltransferase involved in cell wall biosynthesis
MTATPTQPKINIVQVVADGNPGGGTTFVMGLMKHLLKNPDFTVNLITDAQSYGYQTASNLGARTHGVDFFKRKFSLTLPFKLNALINKIKPDMIHIHGGRAGFQMLLCKLLHPGIPFIYTVHGYHFVQKSFLARMIGKIVERCIAALSNHVVFVSKGDEVIAGTYRILSNNYSIIYNGVEEVAAHPSETKTGYDVVFIGRMVHQKNPVIAVNIFKQLQHKHYRLAMIGGGEKEEEIKHLIAQNNLTAKIDFHGAKTHAETLALLSNSKIILLPSLWEGLPITLLEAMQFGIPAVVSNVTGNNEAIEDNVNGFTVDVSDTAAYATKLQKLLEDHALYDRMSKNARKYFEEKYQLKTCTQQYEALYYRYAGKP